MTHDQGKSGHWLGPGFCFWPFFFHSLNSQVSSHCNLHKWALFLILLCDQIDNSIQKSQTIIMVMGIIFFKNVSKRNSSNSMASHWLFNRCGWLEDDSRRFVDLLRLQTTKSWPRFKPNYKLINNLKMEKAKNKNQSNILATCLRWCQSLLES